MLHISYAYTYFTDITFSQKMDGNRAKYFRDSVIDQKCLKAFNCIFSISKVF